MDNAFTRATRIVEAGIARATHLASAELGVIDPRARAVLWRLEEIRLVAGYAEPGYGGLSPEDAVIALGNWNPIGGFDLPRAHIGNLPARIGSLLEKAGAEIEWGDEWTECVDCGKAVRTQADSYSWTCSFVWTDDGAVCEDCALEDPTSYLESLEDDPRSAVTFDIDPESHGYVRIPERFENGLYGGQCARPENIAEALRDVGCYRFLFKIDSVGQFDARFSVYVHEDEMEEMGANPEGTAAFLRGEADGPDPAAMFKQAVANIPAHVGPGIQHVTIDTGNGTATSKMVSSQDFIDGNL